MESWPIWIAELVRLLPIRSQFVLSGNIRDWFLIPDRDNSGPQPLVQSLWKCLQSDGFECLAIYDRVDGLRPSPDSPESADLLGKIFDLKFEDRRRAVELPDLCNYLRRAVTSTDRRIAVIIDY